MAQRRKRGTSALTKFEGGLAPLDAGLEGLSSEWQEKLAGYAKNEAAAASGSGGWPYISLRGGAFKLAGEQGPLPNPLPVIVLGAAPENTYYEGDFDPDTPQNPTCYALGITDDGTLTKPEDLAPPAELKTRQHETCRGCWADAFGSSKTGRGKACGNRRRLILLPAFANPENRVLDVDFLREVPGARLRVPVTSVSGREVMDDRGARWLSFSGYHQRLESLGRSWFSVVTLLRLVPDPRSQFRLGFAPLAAVASDEVLEVLEARYREGISQLAQPPQAAAEEAAAGGGAASRGGGKRKVRRRRASGAAANA